MQLYQREKCLKDSKEVICRLGFRLESNKAKDLIRLVYEICLRENISAFSVIPSKILPKSALSLKDLFSKIKTYLIKRRYPELSKAGNLKDIYLGRPEFNRGYSVSKVTESFSPERIFVEKQIIDLDLTKNILSRFKEAEVDIIASLPQHLKSRKKFSIEDYNQRHKLLFLVKEKYDFVKPCPCTRGCVCCGYAILNLGFGCIYECSYCFLQGYTNAPGIVIPVNIEDYLRAVEIFVKNNNGIIRIGTGEFTDSLALDYITEFSKILIPFFAKFNNVFFELKTKSANIKNILGIKDKSNSVIAWSLNPEEVIESDEWTTSSLKERLESARLCSENGYLVAFHFDPIVYSQNWQIQYKRLVELLFKKIKKEKIAWISLGTFRFPPILKSVIEQRFPETKILNEELVLGFDRKVRYPHNLRVWIYKKMRNLISGFDKNARVYLCMESPAVWEEVFKEKPNAHQLFSLRQGRFNPEMKARG